MQSQSEEAVIAKVTSLLEQQSARLEANDLRRQETVFKLLSSELKSNTTSVVVGAVKQEIKDSCVFLFYSCLSFIVPFRRETFADDRL
jgi:hypothetical protein